VNKKITLLEFNVIKWALGTFGKQNPFDCIYLASIWTIASIVISAKKLGLKFLSYTVIKGVPLLSVPFNSYFDPKVCTNFCASLSFSQQIFLK
jgi:hypothetical protein